MPRILLLLFLAGMLAARASDAIDAPTDGASAKVTQPHVIAELIPEGTAVEAGKPFAVALHLHMDAGWHTYWINPGDAGLATTIKWTLPPGFTAGPIQWPAPELHAMGPLVTYGYGGDVYLLTTITPPAGELPQHFDVKAKANWLVCKEECIPGKAELTVTLDSGFMNLRLPKENTELFAQAKARIPADDPGVSATGSYGDDRATLIIHFKDGESIPRTLRFFPAQANVLSTQAADNPPPENAGKPLADGRTNMLRLRIGLQQNGDKPDQLSGVLLSDQPIFGDAKAIEVPAFAVASSSGSPDNALSGPRSDSGATGSSPAASTVAQGSAAGTAAATTAATATPTTSDVTPSSDGHRPPLQQAQPYLVAVLAAAFVGGLILNLMPCVLPVLSLKVFSLVKHAGSHPQAAWRQGLAFTAGVVLSFWVLAGVLLALRAAGHHLGWGFQMQSPGFVAGLILLFFLIGLNLFGVFEIGTSLVGIDAKATSHAGGGTSSFLNGALATVAATPCTAPFMGSALGFAAQQPAAISLLVFTFLGLGMAAPYLLLSAYPRALRFVPKPGPWMEGFKQLMGFLLMATVIFLLYVFGALVGNDRLPSMLGILLFVGAAAWIYGRWGEPVMPLGWRVAGITLCLLILAGALLATIGLAREDRSAGQAAATAEGWQPWSPDAVDAALAQGKPVFVDFTAAWCLSCKVNEAEALGSRVVKAAFAQKGVALFRADWTHSDPRITTTLQQYNRDGVPLYLLYSPKAKDAPQVLPEVLTPGIVLRALDKI